MEPTIYKPSIYKGAGIYKAGAEGGGGEKEIIIPTGYKRLQYVEINDTKPYCTISENDMHFFFNIPSVQYGDKIECEILLNADTTTNNKHLDLFCRNANGGTNSFAFQQFTNLNGNGYAIRFILNGLFNYGSYQKYIDFYGSNYSVGLYNINSYFDDNLKGSVNSQIVQLGTAPKDYSARLSLLNCDEWATSAYKGTKIFKIKILNKLNFIPCQRISDGMVGFWENETEVFVYPRGTYQVGSLTAGPDY